MNIVHKEEETMPKIIENAREKIIEEGREKLISEGYRALNIRDVAKVCGIGTGTVYNYFSSKIELVRAIFGDDWDKTIKLIGKCKNSEEPFKSKLQDIYLSMRKFLQTYVTIFYEIAMVEKYEKNDENEFQKFYEAFEELINYELERGSIKSTLSAKKLTYFIASNLIYLCKNEYMSFDELFDNLKL